MNLDKVVSRVFVLVMACLLIPEVVFGNCPAYERRRAAADAQRRSAQSSCGLASGIGGTISCSIFGLGTGFAGAAACGLDFVWLDGQCDEEAEQQYDLAVGGCRIQYVLGNGCG